MSIDNTDDAPEIRQVNVMFTEAIRKGASDIRIEPADCVVQSSNSSKCKMAA